LHDLVSSISTAAAASVARYVDASGMKPDVEMPKYVLAAGVLHDLSRTYTMTLDTGVRELIQRTRATLPQFGTAQATILAQPSDQLRVDLVAYERSGGDRSIDPIFALVEFKRHKVNENDRFKIRRIGELVPKCPYGVVCSLVNVPHDSEWLVREEWNSRQHYGGVVARIPVILSEPLPDFAIFAHGFPLR
jgi:hypothetical protein